MDFLTASLTQKIGEMKLFRNFHLKFKTVNLINAKSFDLQFYRFFEVLL